MELYRTNCPKCRHETPHRISSISRTKGIRLRCAVCKWGKNKNYAPGELVPWEVK